MADAYNQQLLQDNGITHILDYDDLSRKLHKFDTALLIQHFEDRPWNTRKLSDHSLKHLPFQLVIRYPERDWNWQRLSKHPKLNWRFVAAYAHKPWCWKRLALRKDIDWHVITLPHLRHLMPYGKIDAPSHIKAKYWYLPWKNHHKARRDLAASIIQSRLTKSLKRCN